MVVSVFRGLGETLLVPFCLSEPLVEGPVQGKRTSEEEPPSPLKRHLGVRCSAKEEPEDFTLEKLPRTAKSRFQLFEKEV